MRLTRLYRGNLHASLEALCEPEMTRLIWWLILILGIAVFSASFYNAFLKVRPVPQPVTPAPVPPPPAPPKEPEIRFPVPEQQQKQPLPSLNESDSTMTQAMGTLWNGQSLEQVLHLQDVIRRVVATVDGLPRRKLPVRIRPTKPAAGQFLVSHDENTVTISPENSKRYSPYVRLAESLDAKKLVALYVHFYPLFQQAYLNLGYPKGYFNDRLIEAIDDLLATPEITAPAKLVRPKVFYQFADPELEERSAGQKILMRIGHDNAARIKAKLREIRNELTHQPPKP